MQVSSIKRVQETHTHAHNKLYTTFLLTYLENFLFFLLSFDSDAAKPVENDNTIIVCITLMGNYFNKIFAFSWVSVYIKAQPIDLCV